MFSILGRHKFVVGTATLVLATTTGAVALASARESSSVGTVAQHDWAAGTPVAPATVVAPGASGERASTAWIVGRFKTSAVEYLLLARSSRGQHCVLLADRLAHRSSRPTVVQQSCDDGPTKPFVLQVHVPGGGTVLFGGVPAGTAAVQATTAGRTSAPIGRAVRTTNAPVDPGVSFFTVWLPSSALGAVALRYLRPHGSVRSTETVAISPPTWQLRSCGRSMGQARCPSTAAIPH